MTELHDSNLEKNANDYLLAPETNDVKLHREYNLLSEGLASGFVSRAEEAKEHPALTSLEIVGSAAVGAGFTWMRAMGGRPAAVAKAGAYLLTTMAEVDVATRVAPSILAMNDTWQSGDNFEIDKNVIASKLGSALFDYPLMAASGRLGSYGATTGREFVVTKFSDASLRSAAPLLTSQIPLKEQSLSSKLGVPEPNAASERTLSIDDVLSGKISAT
ncbi:MAG: hypothetical protein K2X81_27520 [Candidatus Obscuribacterales bacterium]|nr:hypothetical protein [Candidatus Obscuribacterales bacterium]